MTPVLIIIFNRPDKVRTLMQALEKARPARLFISADSPRPHVAGEAQKCAEARRIATSVSWPCEIETNFSDKNLGCRLGVSSAITWFFSRVDEGIILEDDCVPDPAFFPYCAELLERYRGDERVMHISGTTLLDADEVTDPLASYHFSYVSHVWGWATWKRAWEKFDMSMSDIAGLASSPFLHAAFEEPSHARFWIRLFVHIRDRHIDTWDAQWSYSILANRGLSITPQANLVENIGFGADATHTRNDNVKLPRTTPLAFPLSHPSVLMVDKAADRRLMNKIYAPGVWRRIASRLKLPFRLR